MKHRCVNCARYIPKDDGDSWCDSEYDIRTDPESLEDPETERCNRWIAMKHLPMMVLRGALRQVDYSLRCDMPDGIRYHFERVKEILERGLRK